MKKIILLLGLITLLANVSFAQENKTVTLTVSGQGQTQDEAKQNALRNAIEQAFGTFISSNTEILNDDLVKDEIVSVSNGNIQKFEILSEVQMQNGEWSNTLKAVVSVTKLTSFCESKGISVEFKGSLFAYNINQQILNEKNEVKAIEDVCQVIRNIADVSFDFTITASDPISLDASNSKWRIPMSVSVYKNDNFNNIPKILHSTLKGISLSLDEARNYINLGKKVYPISFAANNTDYSYILLRQEESVKKLLSTLYYFNHSLQNFRVDNGIDQFKINSNKINNLKIKDDNFRIFVIKIGKCRSRETYIDGSVFFDISGNANSRNIVNEPILDWVKWASIGRQWYGCGYGWSKNYVGYAFEVYTTNYPYDGFFNNRFTFVNKLSKQFINSESGVVISFSDNVVDNVVDNAFKKKKNNSNENNVIIRKELVKFEFEDIRSINEINKISEYKVLPIGN